jgi:hypothetical protein
VDGGEARIFRATTSSTTWAWTGTCASNSAHPQYQRTIEFCARYDAAAFDPDYESLPLSFFEPMLERVFAQPSNRSTTALRESA